MAKVFFTIIFITTLRYESTSSFEFVSSDQAGRYTELTLSQVVGPESVAFDCRDDGPYVGVSDGRILRWRGQNLGWSEFTVTAPNRERNLCDGSADPAMEQTCGRPLGLRFDYVTCDLYIADAYYGLLKVGEGGGVAKQLASYGGGVAVGFANGLDIDSTTGEVYFTDSSLVYKRREYLLAIVNGDQSGRLMKYNPKTNKVTVLLTGLSFPNGLALSKDNSFFLVAETGKMRVLRFWLKGTRTRTMEVFAQLGRYPDNVKRTLNGDFWVALNSGRGALKSGLDMNLWLTRDPVAVKLDRNGRMVEVMDGGFKKTFESVSEVEEKNDTLDWFCHNAIFGKIQGMKTCLTCFFLLMETLNSECFMQLSSLPIDTNSSSSARSWQTEKRQIY